ncbi:MAG: acyl-homoserine-lactone synthase [Rhodothalassiaceae bacterium]
MIRIVTTRNRRAHAGALIEMHRQRKAVFVDRLGWDLAVTGGLEFDAYDGRHALYLLSIEKGRLMSSARLLPTTRPHLMSNRFAHLCSDGVPRGCGVWEASRFCVNPAITETANRHAQLGLIIAGILEAGLARSIDQVTFVAGSALLPLALDAGWDARPLGPPCHDGRDTITAVAAEITQAGLAAVRRRYALEGCIIQSASFKAAV